MQIELYSKLNEPLDAIDRMGTWFASSGMFGCTKAEQGKVLALVCVTEQMSPVQVLEKYYVMGDGKLSKKAHGLLAAFLKMGGKHTWLKDGTDGKSARLKLEMDGRATVECEYSMEDAKLEGLLGRGKGSAWDKRPRIMMRARCETEGIAMICPEIAVDDYADSEATQAAPLLPPQPKPEVKADAPPSRKKKEEKPIEAEVISSPAGESVPANRDESARASDTNSRTSAQPGLIKVTIEDGKVSKASVQAFTDLCQSRGQEFDAKAMAWLESHGYVTKGNLFSITPERLQKIFDQWDNWVKAVEAVKP